VFLIHLPAIMDLRFEAICANGYVRILDNNDRLEIYTRQGRTYSFDAQRPSTTPASSHLALVRDLVHAVRTGAKPLANEVVALQGMAILMGAAQSHLADGSAVQLPLPDRSMYIPSH
jgi:predicted dehydrogenase